MNSYTSLCPYYASSPSMPYNYSNYNTPPPTFCSCCCSPTTYYPTTVQSSMVFTPPSSPYIPYSTQVPTPTVVTQPVDNQQSSSKITRLQYSSKHRYILNELFRRTPYPNASQRGLIAQKLGITQEQVRIWFQNRRRLQTQRDTGERIVSPNELVALQQGKICVDPNELMKLLDDVAHFKNAPPRLRLDESL